MVGSPFLRRVARITALLSGKSDCVLSQQNSLIRAKSYIEGEAERDEHPDDKQDLPPAAGSRCRSEEHTSELQSLMRISYAVFCLKKQNNTAAHTTQIHTINRNNNI